MDLSQRDKVRKEHLHLKKKEGWGKAKRMLYVVITAWAKICIWVKNIPVKLPDAVGSITDILAVYCSTLCNPVLLTTRTETSKNLTLKSQ